eukprot:6061394-Pyramimonas_sp.AAC.1
MVSTWGPLCRCNAAVCGYILCESYCVVVIATVRCPGPLQSTRRIGLLETKSPARMPGTRRA